MQSLGIDFNKTINNTTIEKNVLVVFCRLIVLLLQAISKSAGDQGGRHQHKKRKVIDFCDERDAQATTTLYTKLRQVLYG